MFTLFVLLPFESLIVNITKWQNAVFPSVTIDFMHGIYYSNNKEHVNYCVSVTFIRGVNIQYGYNDTLENFTDGVKST